jgi:hypothetical protein
MTWHSYSSQLERQEIIIHVNYEMNKAPKNAQSKTKLDQQIILVEVQKCLFATDASQCCILFF